MGHCTKIGHTLVIALHLIVFKGDISAVFSIDLKIGRSKKRMFFDEFGSLPGWCGVRGSSGIALRHRKMKGEEGQRGSIARRWSR
jgi:hypothetical protein